MKIKKLLAKAWHFVWEDNSVWSWLVNVVLAFVLIKFIVYPVLGLLLGTSFPIVAVVSGSMEHGIKNNDHCVPSICGYGFKEEKSLSFDSFWSICGKWYEQRNISKAKFSNFELKDGFNKGDIIILKGAPPEDLKVGDIIVFSAGKPDPIIHRVVGIKDTVFQTKGDHNEDQIRDSSIDENNVRTEKIIGKSFIRIPLLGYLKIWAVDLITGHLFKAQRC